MFSRPHAHLFVHIQYLCIGHFVMFMYLVHVHVCVAGGGRGDCPGVPESRPRTHALQRHQIPLHPTGYVTMETVVKML